VIVKMEAKQLTFRGDEQLILADPTGGRDIFIKLPSGGFAEQLMGVDVKPEEFAAQRMPEWTLAQAARAGVENAYHAVSNAATMARAFC
jgi:hypothetical protein